jgi:hypothetical protein
MSAAGILRSNLMRLAARALLDRHNVTHAIRSPLDVDPQINWRPHGPSVLDYDVVVLDGDADGLSGVRTCGG